MNFILNSILSIIGKFAGAFIGLLTGIILARALGPERLGQYQLFLSSQTIIITLFSLGIGNASIYFISSNQISQREVVSTFVKIFLPLSIIVSIIFGFLILFYDTYFGSVLQTSLIVFLIGTSSLVLSSILRPILYTQQKIKRVTFLNTLPPFILLIGVSTIYFLSTVKVETGLFFWGVGNLVACVLLLIYFKKDIDLKLPFDLKKIKEIILYGIKLSATNLLFVFIGNISIFLLKYLLINGFEAVGLYSRAIAICSLIFMIPTSIGPLLFSKWSSLEKNKLKKQAELTIRILVFLTLFISLFVIFFRKEIIYLFYGNKYMVIHSAIIILTPTLIFQSISEIINNLFASIGKAGITLYVFIGTLILIFISNLVLIPSMGIVGAAISVLIGSVFNAVSLLLIAKKIIKISIIDCLVIKKNDFTFFNNIIKKHMIK